MTSTTRPLVIYHGNCPDGFCAAWVTARALGDVELFAGKYGDPAPLKLAAGRPVYIVDFSYDRVSMNGLIFDASSFVCLDHHKTAEAELEGAPGCTFDMNRSGAGMAWDFFHPGQPRPWIVDYVEDRDLWRHALPNSDLISLRIRLEPHELEAYDALAQKPIDTVIGEAAGAKRYLDHYIRDVHRNLYRIDRDDMVVVNCTYSGVSDVLNDALKLTGASIALGWHLDADGQFACSLRSKPGVDCSAMAKSFGGGGHAQAAGFSLPANHPFALKLIHETQRLEISP